MSAGPNPGDWGKRRKALTWLNVLTQVIFLLGVVVVANLLARKAVVRFDMTSRGTFELSSLTVDLLQTLDFDLKIWMTPPIPTMREEDKSLNVARRRTVELLGEFSRRSPERIRFKYLEGTETEEIAEVRLAWGEVSSDSIYFLADLGEEKTSKRTVGLYQLFRGDPATGEIASFAAEPIFAQVIRELAQRTKRIYYEVAGHKEFLTKNMRDLSVLGRFFEENEGVEFRTFETAAGSAVPADCDVLMIVGPVEAFALHEVQILREYVDRGGSLFVALHPRIQTGLDAFLEECGVRLGKGLVHDSVEYHPPRMTTLSVKKFSDHPINQVMVNTRLLLPDCAMLVPLEMGNPEWVIQPIAVSGDNAWEELGPFGPDQILKPDPGEPTSHLALVVAIEKPVRNPIREPPEKSRIIVWGSATALYNSVLSPPRRGFDSRKGEYLLNNFRWLSAKDVLPSGPSIKDRPLELEKAQITRLWWVTVVGFPLLGIVLGVFAWIFRRK